MKRRVLNLAALALVGMLASLSVAWWCALWSPLRGSRALTDAEAGTVLRRLTGRLEPRAVPQGIRQWGVGLAFVFAVDFTIPPPETTTAAARARPRSAEVIRALPTSPDDRVVHVVTAGWPLTCLTGEAHTVGTATQPHGIAEPPELVRLLDVKPRRVLPLRPRWLGFAANTTLYAAAAWLLVPGPLLLRRLLRRRRGRCAACGYNLRHVDHAACPECGAAA